MITTPIFTRLMDTTEYGKFGVFNSWYVIIAVFVSLNLFYAVHVQGIVKFSEEKNLITSSLQGLTTVLVVIWSIVYLIFHDFWNRLFSLSTVQMLSMMIIIWTTAVFTFWSNEQRSNYSYRPLVLVTLAVSIAKPGMEIFLVIHLHDKVTARILGWMIVEFVAYTWMYVYHIKKGGKFFSKKFWLYALSYNIPLVPHYLSQTVLNSSDRIMIENLVGSSESGIYNLAYSISLIMTLFNTALMQTITPWMYQKISEKKGKETAPIVYSTLFAVAVVNLLLIILAPEIVTVFAPKEYYDAIWVIPPVAMSVFFMCCFDLFARFAFYYEKTKMVMIASVSSALLNILLNYIFIKRFGYVAAGYTTLACFMVYSIVHYCFMRKVCRECCDGEYPYETRRIFMIAAPFLVAGFVFMSTYKYPVIRYGIFVAAIVVTTIMRKKIIRIIMNIISLKKQIL